VTEVRFAGSGGQGVAVAGLLLAEAAIATGKNATFAQSYGPESRGGSSRADVIVSDDEIDFPFASRPDVLVALTEDAARRHAGELVPGGLLIVDSAAQPRDDPRQIALAMSEAARRELGTSLGTNLVALGALVATTALAPIGSVESAIAKRPPGGSVDRAIRAFRLGVGLVRSKEGRDGAPATSSS
jgi:2-oxoglutarate ferredoxin oxidoreductase subunit gamma